MRQSIWRLKLLAIALAGASNLSAVAQETVQGDAFLATVPGGQSVLEPRQEDIRIADSTQAAQVQKIDVVFPNGTRRFGRAIGPLRVAKLNIIVGQDGRARDVRIAKSSGFTPYDKAALSAAKEATYVPAVNQGMPVESRLAYEVSFGLLCNRAEGDTSCDYNRYPTKCSATVCSLLMR